jgi:hypothetical protein
MIKGFLRFACFEMVFKALTQSLIAAGISAIPWYESFALIHESPCRSGPRGKATSAGIRPLSWLTPVTFANDWLSFTSDHNHRQTFPAFTKILLESRLAFVQRLSWSCPVCTRKEHSSCFSFYSPLITTRMAGSVSWVWNSTGGKRDVSLSRQQRIYSMFCFSRRLETRVD